MTGLRGVGKTVLLNEIRKKAEADGFLTTMIEAQEDQALGVLLGPGLRKVLFALSPGRAVGEKVAKGFRVLKSFLSGVKFGVGEAFIGIDSPPERGVADSGLLGSDLPDLFVAIGEAAVEAGAAVAVIIDELQYLSEGELSALIMAIHKVSQEGLPLILIGAGLPQLAGNTGAAKSYAERLFLFPKIGPLPMPDARKALQEPVTNLGVEFTDSALDEIFRRTEGYPYFLQEWGSQSWRAAQRSPIDVDVVHQASRNAIQSLDKNFFTVRFDRLTPREKEYMRALAELGCDPQRSGEIASVIGMSSESAAPLRSGLIKKGMIYSPQHGDTAFTVPLFDQFLKRTMPDIPMPRPQRRKRESKQ
jgi:AAA+ ATPase superfamily predicted ATPase